ncbi:hypothetical protein XENORESO_007030 [Xenotaenia resolanae]|uniref:Reverse transcriptase zinc-binding domain-containing protein n=1 Tax=Xenotaenia resolanae TaxID=208358 RepID=A0ABV0WL82_9TELE
MQRFLAPFLLRSACYSDRGQDSSPSPTLTPMNSPVGKICLTSPIRKNNKSIRSLFQRKVTSVPAVVPYWNRFVTDVSWKHTWLLPNHFLLTNKVKEVTFELIHRIYPAKDYLKKFKSDIVVNCPFCDLLPEFVTHVFWLCPYSKAFWKHSCNYMDSNILEKCKILWENILFGFQQHNKMYPKVFFINL